jgi:oligoendopeptidase F
LQRYYTETLNFKDPKDIEERFLDLINETIESGEDLENWLIKQSEFSDALYEGFAGHYIDFQCHNDDEEIKRVYSHDQDTIKPIVKKYQALAEKKFYDSPFKDELPNDYYVRFKNSNKNTIELFREENIPLEIEEDRLVTQYFEYTGSLTGNWNGEEKTLSELYSFLQDPDRDTRKKAMALQYEAILAKAPELQEIMSKLIKLREDKAKNAGLANYRDYMFKKYERFDYTPEDCKELAEAIRKYVLPLKKKLDEKHKEDIKVDTYRPWDTQAVPAGLMPLKPFVKSEELIKGTTSILQHLDSDFSGLLNKMQSAGALDLDSRKGKSQGGFCESLPVSNNSFIFMNADGNHDDVVTLLHEMGHSIHNDLMQNIPLSKYRDIPMESAELASMSMELLTMEYWDEFYKTEEELKRAKRDELRGIIQFLPSGVIVDQFQHWLYENPAHTPEERNQKFEELTKEYNTSLVDWSGYEEWAQNRWLFILHIFEVPFYYIEYVIAQLGALQMYKQYKENPQQTIENYKKALTLGCSKSLSEVYETAGIRFDFSGEMIKNLMEFVAEELELLD